MLDPADPILFEARLTPHRSLDRRGFLLVMALVASISFIAGLAFWARGAWPVAGFCGLDVAVMWWALRANFRAAQAYEEIRVTPHEVFVRRVDAKGNASEWRCNPFWVRLEVVTEEDEGVTHLALRSRGVSRPVASFLGAPERTEFAAALQAALAEARVGRIYSVNPA